MGIKKGLLIPLFLFLSGMAFASGLFDSSGKSGANADAGANASNGAPADAPGAAAFSESEPGSAADAGGPPVAAPVEEGTTYSSPVEGMQPSFRLSESDSGILFYQRLSWEKAEYAVRYTVILQRKRENADAFTEVLRRNVDTPYTDISLPPGEYRYSVMSFNIVGLLDFQTDWEYFTVLQALHPSVVSFTPEAFYFDRPSARIITLIGENLLPQAEIFLVSKTSLNESGEPLILTPREIYRNELGENARLLFYEEDLVAGQYDFMVKNPGGLVATAGSFTIATAKPFDINVSGGYGPMLTLFGQTDHFLDRLMIPLGFSLRGSFVPFKRPFGNLGAELNADWSYLTSDQGGFKTSANLVLVRAGGLFQYWILPKKLSVNGRLGLGVAGIFNYRFTYDTGKTGEPINNAAFAFGAGASVQWLFFRQFFVEGGVDYVQVVHSEIPMGFVRFGVYAGYQF